MKAKGICCVRAAALQLPPSPHPWALAPLISSLPFKHRGQAERAEICLALGLGELGPVRTCPLTSGEEGVSLNADFSCPPFPAQNSLAWVHPPETSVFTQALWLGFTQGPAAGAYLQFSEEKGWNWELQESASARCAIPRLAPKLGLPKPPPAACDGIMCLEEGKKKCLERPSMCKQENSVLRKSYHYHWNINLRLLTLQVLLGEWESKGEVCKVQMTLKSIKCSSSAPKGCVKLANSFH